MDDTHPRKCDVMDRRGFLAKGAVGGAIVVGGGLLTGVGSAFAAKPPSTLGYKVGDKAADFGAYDQYMKPRKLSNNLGSWVLIDLCPVWCAPCNYSARWQFAFTNYVRSQAIPFRMQPVVVESGPGQPSTRRNAEQWAVRYELEREALMHDNGDITSPLHQLVVNYAQANGNSDPGYPTYVLVDPSGVIRGYYLGGDQLNNVQQTIASATAKTLNKDWLDESLIPTYTALADPNVGSASFKLWDGTAVSMPGPNGHIENDYATFDTSGGGVNIDLWSKLGDPVTSGPVRDHSKEFDLHSPITMTFKVNVSPDPGSYRQVQITAADFLEYAPGYYPGAFAVDKGQAAPNFTYNSDGSIQMTYTASDSFSNGTWVGPDDDGNASNETVIAYGLGGSILPYQSALELIDSVNSDGSLSTTTKSTVASLLAGGNSKLGNRDYAGSAQQFAKAERTLQAAPSGWAGSAGNIKLHVAWLGTHYNT